MASHCIMMAWECIAVQCCDTSWRPPKPFGFEWKLIVIKIFGFPFLIATKPCAVTSTSTFDGPGDPALASFWKVNYRYVSVCENFRNPTPPPLRFTPPLRRKDFSIRKILSTACWQDFFVLPLGTPDRLSLLVPLFIPKWSATTILLKSVY